MKLSSRIYLVGGGLMGFGISEDLDCHVYLIDGGSELALIDAGAGVTIEPIIRNIVADGLAPAKLKHLILTHAHADHAGGAWAWRERFGVEVSASREAASYLRNADEERVSLAVAKRGGFYPSDYAFRACPVSRELCEGDKVRVGDLELAVIETPGHCSGMLSLLLKQPDKSVLFSGDTVFHNGRILATNVWDCDVPRYAHSIEKLAALEFDALLPGHLTIAMQKGSDHVQKAWQTLQKLTLPPNIL